MKSEKRIIVQTENMDKYFTLVCEKLENLEKLTQGFEPKRQFIHTQVLHTKAQFLKFMQIVCANLSNQQQIIDLQKQKLGIKDLKMSRINENISELLGNNEGNMS